MKTLIDIPREKIEKAKKAGQFETIKETVEQALDEFINRRQIEKLAEKLGTFDDFISSEELQAMNEKDSTRIFCLD